MEQGARRGCEVCAGNRIGDCQGRIRRKSERMEGGREETLSWAGELSEDWCCKDANSRIQQHKGIPKFAVSIATFSLVAFRACEGRAC